MKLGCIDINENTTLFLFFRAAFVSAVVRGFNGLSSPPGCWRRHAGETTPVPVKRYVGVLCSVTAIAAAIVGVESVRQKYWTLNSHVSSPMATREDRIDSDLSIAAASALGNREGTVIVMDPRTGRIRAVVNRELAFETAFTPGSTIKPFTTLAALRSGTIEKDSRMLCREHYSHEDYNTVCSHPRGLPPLKLAEALAYSCNYYFGRLGEQLSDSTLNLTLAEFGFGQPTKSNRIDFREAAGKVPQGQRRAATVLGEGDQIQVTPVQLLSAYSALLNGGHLLVPEIATEAGFVAQHQREISIDNTHRELIVDGMRGAVRYGTAERAKLHSLPIYVIGKTGTATPPGGFRNHGWFVGFASEFGDDAPGKSETIKLAVLVFLKRAHGADAAMVARPILESYIQSMELGERETRRHGDAERRGRGDTETPGELDTDPSASDSFAVSPRLRVAVSSSSRVIPLEDYILGVVAAEGSTEEEPEALKALAVASRTYALKNRRRHAVNGYDFCTTTHCQRYQAIEGSAGSLQNSAAISRAVRETAGQALYDNLGRIVDSYFSASCGGASSNIGTLWGVRTPSYLTGGRDEYCVTMPHHAWTDVISSSDLLRAVESDPRTRVGGRLTSVAVTRRDASGRAELITIDGAHRRVVGGWDFKIIVGRALGWNLLKSSRFEISRSRAGYVFRGKGFGHGLGLCQEGAHVMARRGAGYQQILAKYFPGTRVNPELSGMKSLKFEQLAGQEGWFTPADFHTKASGDKPPFLTCEFEQPGRAIKRTLSRKLDDHHISPSPRNLVISHHSVTSNHPVSVSPHLRGAVFPLLRPASQRRTLSSEHFHLSYPVRLGQREAEYVLKLSESNRADLVRRAATSGVTVRLPALELFINESTGDFVGRTGQPHWVAAATLRNRIELQPYELLARRRILETTLRHELVHATIEEIGYGRTPRWLAEGLALHLAGEGPRVVRHLREADLTLADLEVRLSRPATPEEMRANYAAAYREVKKLIDAEGDAAIWRRVIASR